MQESTKEQMKTNPELPKAYEAKIIDSNGINFGKAKAITLRV